MSARTIWHGDSEWESDGACTASDASSTGLTEPLESCDLSDISSLTWLAFSSLTIGDARLRRSVEHWRRSSFTADEAHESWTCTPPGSCSSSIICRPTDAGPHRPSISASMPPFVAPGSTRWYPSDHHWTWTSSALHAFRSAGRSRSLRSRRRHVADATKRLHDLRSSQDRLRSLIEDTRARKRNRPDCDVLGLVPLASYADDALLIRGGLRPPRKTILKTIAKENLWNTSRPCCTDIFDALAAAL